MSHGLNPLFLDNVAAGLADGLELLARYDAGDGEAVATLSGLVPTIRDAEGRGGGSLPFLVENAVMLSAEEVVTFHECVGSGSLRSRELLESAVGRQHMALAFWNPDFHDLALLVAEGIVRDHPFTDGNKRTALLAMGATLLANGFPLPDPAVGAAIVAGLAERSLTVEEAGNFLVSGNGTAPGSGER